MAIRDPRWRNFNDPFAYTIGYGNGFYNRNSFYNYYNPYSYGFNNSPYNHFYNNWNTFNYGYYYNPYFYPHPIYNPVITKFRPNVVTKPRMVNLDAYNGYNTPNQPRYNNTNRTINASRGYNNTNTGSRVGNAVRKVLTPATSSGRNNSDNNTRSYTPSSSNRSSSPGSSSSGSSSGSGGGGVSRPGRGG